eukprot:SAG31_NODE_84_length_27014_cov_3.743006_23_plen_180_part_00
MPPHSKRCFKGFHTPSARRRSAASPEMCSRSNKTGAALMPPGRTMPRSNTLGPHPCAGSWYRPRTSRCEVDWHTIQLQPLRWPELLKLGFCTPAPMPTVDGSTIMLWLCKPRLDEVCSLCSVDEVCIQSTRDGWEYNTRCKDRSQMRDHSCYHDGPIAKTSTPTDDVSPHAHHEAIFDP